MPNPRKLFYSYAHEDEHMRDQLAKHLALLAEQGHIEPWHDREIRAGQAWEQRILAELDAADIILLLISPAFFASNFCHNIEMPRALARHQAKTALVIPIKLRPCDTNDAAFMHLQGLPKNFLAVTQWPTPDAAYADIAASIRAIITKHPKPPNPLRRQPSCSISLMTMPTVFILIPTNTWPSCTACWAARRGLPCAVWAVSAKPA